MLMQPGPVGLLKVTVRLGKLTVGTDVPIIMYLIFFFLFKVFCSILFQTC